MPDMLCEIPQRLLGRAGVPLEGAEKDRKQSQNSRKEPPKKPKNPLINLDIGEYEKIMKEVARVAL
jgi:hypothetical protein